MQPRRFLFQQPVNKHEPEQNVQQQIKNLIRTLALVLIIGVALAALLDQWDKAPVVIASTILQMLLLAGISKLPSLSPSRYYESVKQLEVVFHNDKIEMIFLDRHHYSIDYSNIKSWQWKPATTLADGTTHKACIAIYTLDGKEYLIRQQPIISEKELLLIANELERVFKAT